MEKLKMNTSVCGFQRTPILDNTTGQESGTFCHDSVVDLGSAEC